MIHNGGQAMNVFKSTPPTIVQNLAPARAFGDRTMRLIGYYYDVMYLTPFRAPSNTGTALGRGPNQTRSVMPNASRPGKSAGAQKSRLPAHRPLAGRTDDQAALKCSIIMGLHASASPVLHLVHRLRQLGQQSDDVLHRRCLDLHLGDLCRQVLHFSCNGF